jgi:hypothetical protein
MASTPIKSLSWPARKLRSSQKSEPWHHPNLAIDLLEVFVMETKKLHGGGRRHQALEVCRKFGRLFLAGGDSEAPNFRTDKPITRHTLEVEQMVVAARRGGAQQQSPDLRKLFRRR